MKRSAHFLLVAAVASAVSTLVPNVAASAAVPAPNRYEATTANTSTSPKTAIVYCPAGTAILGGGAQILGGHGQVALLSAEPVFDPFAVPAFQRYFRVTAAEDKTGTTKPWSLKASVYCTSQTITQIVTSTSNLDSAPVKSVSSECPEGMKVVGAGGRILVGTTPGPPPDALVNLVSFSPSDDLTEVMARGTEPGGILDDQYPGLWSVTSVAVCGYAYAFDGLERRESTLVASLDDNDPGMSTEIWCSEDDRLVAAGVDLADDSANTYVQWGIRSNVADTKVSAAAFLNPEMGISLAAQLTAYAICVDS